MRRHLELDGQREMMLETVAAPDIVQQGDFGTLLAAKHFKETPLTEKFMVVVYREVGDVDGFILTAYFTKELSGRRRTVWTR